MGDAGKGDVCNAISILVAAGILDYNGHVSLRIDENTFYINSGRSNRNAMSVDQVSVVSIDEEVLEGDRAPNEVSLHAAILRERDDVCAVVHGHPKWSTLFTATNSALPTVMPQGSLVSDLPLYPQSHSISTPERGSAVAALLGDNPGALLRSHGSVLVGTSLREAVCRAIYVEQNAERAYLGQSLGTLQPLANEEIAEYRKTLTNPGLYSKCWNFYLPQKGA